MKKNLKILLVFIISVTFFACQEEPSGIGSNILPDADKVKLLKIDNLTDTIPLSSSIFKKIVETGSSLNVLMGKYNGIECYGIFRVLDIPDTIINSTIISASLLLRTSAYALDNNTAPMNLSVYKINTTWSLSTLDSTIDAGFDWDKTPSGGFSGTLVDTTFVKINLDVDLIKNWADTSKKSENQGIVIISNPSNNVIRSFYSSDNSTYYPLIEVIREKSGVRDTLIYSYIEDAYYTKRSQLNVQPQYLYLQSGVAYRSRLIFDFYKIPKYAYISYAGLTLTLEKSQSVLGLNRIDSLVAAFVTDADKNTTSETVLGTPYFDDRNRYVFNITSFVQSWVNGTANHGLDLHALGETLEADLIALSSEKNSTKENLPKLTIVYFIAPK